MASNRQLYWYDPQKMIMVFDPELIERVAESIYDGWKTNHFYKDAKETNKKVARRRAVSVLDLLMTEGLIPEMYP